MKVRLRTKMNDNTLETCLNRTLGRCKGCKKDYDPKHCPNNYDCPHYIPHILRTFEVKDKNSP